MEWLRYEMEGLNHWRIDEKYDDDDPSNGIDANDPFRIQRYYVNGPGQLGQIVITVVYDYSGEEPVSTDYYYGYDVLGNVSVISNSNGAEADQFEQDAFGNQVENSWYNPIANITEHLTTKQYDADLGPNGLYYFQNRWYDPLQSSFLSKYRNWGELWYAISDNRPTMMVDLDGLSSIDPPPGEDSFWCPGARKIQMEVDNYLRQHCGNANKDNSPENAFEHCLLTCLVYTRIGSTCAAALDLRETQFYDPEDHPGSQEMDRRNKLQGYYCGMSVGEKPNPFYESLPPSAQDKLLPTIPKCSCEECCREKLKNGELTYIIIMPGPPSPDNPLDLVVFVPTTSVGCLGIK